MAVEFAAALPYYVDAQQLYSIERGFAGIGNSTVAAHQYRILRTSADPELKFLGLAGLARAGDRSAIAEIAANISLIPGLKVSRSLLSDAVRSQRDADPVAIQALGAIALSVSGHGSPEGRGRRARVHPYTRHAAVPGTIARQQRPERT